MSQDAQVNIKLESETRDRWDRHQEEMGFTSRSEFVRFCVNNEIDGNHESEPSTGGHDDETLQEIRNVVIGLTDRMESMEETVSTLSNAVQSDPHTEALADEIFGLLPDEEPGSQQWEEELREWHNELEAIEAGHTDGDLEHVSRSYHGWKGTPEGIAEATGEPVRKVHVAMDKLMAEVPLINAEESDDGETRYWKEV